MASNTARVARGTLPPPVFGRRPGGKESIIRPLVACLTPLHFHFPSGVAFLAALRETFFRVVGFPEGFTQTAQKTQRSTEPVFRRGVWRRRESFCLGARNSKAVTSPTASHALQDAGVRWMPPWDAARFMSAGAWSQKKQKAADKLVCGFRRRADSGFLEHGRIHDRRSGIDPGADVRALTLVPPEHQRAGDVDGRIGAGDDTHEEREREVVDA